MISINRVTSMSFRRIQVTDKDKESEKNLMDLFERLMRHYGKSELKVMNMKFKRHCILIIFTDTSREEYPNWLGGKPPSLEAESRRLRGLTTVVSMRFY
ncbi:hypothetical protein MKX03_031793 [Papaver bracteatum]|nr:hypothetical protein MKX03_031793 [Papaver bracteatum]